MSQDIINQIDSLLQATGHAHHQAYIETDGADPDWPLWYADYLLDKLPQLLNASMTKTEIVYVLVSLDKEQQTLAPGAKWTHYYAKSLVNRYL